ncbi:MAG: 4-(cytidine 5'-diphospho)-2-C-methyl-D-erythritol kinase [Niabella sp.]
MVSFPNCKINIGLHITRRRQDGFHDLETVFYPLPFCDALELLQSDTGTQLYLYGQTIPGNEADNIVLKAFHLLKKDFSTLPDVAIHLLKNIPVGAGLGAGSANGAFALKMLNEMFGLQIPEDRLLQYALQLGSDCPFFIYNRPCYAHGRGENLTPLALDLSGYQIVVINPGIHISTPWAFKQIKPALPSWQLSNLPNIPVTSWKDYVINDFEEVVFKEYPVVANIKQTLYDCGAVFALMSGSGSTVYGLFAKGDLSLPAFPETYFVKAIRL